MADEEVVNVDENNNEPKKSARRKKSRPLGDKIEK
jgi:hypothetical protein